jgi:hypothetical protein
MASSIKAQAAQALLRVLKAKDPKISVGQKLRAAELIRVFLRLGPAEPPTPDTESVRTTEEPTKILDL